MTPAGRGRRFPTCACGAWSTTRARAGAPTTSGAALSKNVGDCPLLFATPESSSLIAARCLTRALPDSPRDAGTPVHWGARGFGVVVCASANCPDAVRCAARRRRVAEAIKGRRPTNPVPASPAPVTPRASPVRSRASTATSRSAASAAERPITAVLCRICGRARSAASAAEQPSVRASARPVHRCTLDPSTCPSATGVANASRRLLVCLSNARTRS